jgi:hypothetical protein
MKEVVLMTGSELVLRRTILCILIALATGSMEATAESSAISVPAFGDEYSLLVAKLELGDTNIDYAAFRESFLHSKQFEVAGSRHEELRRLRASVPELIQKSQYSELVRTMKSILSIDYTDMSAHKFLQQTYKIVGDEVNTKKYHDIEFGLLNSIVRNGDGKSCPTAWPVVQIEEEYFILGVLGAKLRHQSIDNQGGLCDKMETSRDGRDATYYFDVARILKRYEGR